MSWGAVYVCADIECPEPEDDCPNALHDFPLPSGYGDAHDVAARRLRRGWSNVRCPDCDLYGWRPGVRDADSPQTLHISNQEES